jgi:hypothetical protein
MTPGGNTASMGSMSGAGGYSPGTQAYTPSGNFGPDPTGMFNPWQQGGGAAISNQMTQMGMDPTKYEANGTPIDQSFLASQANNGSTAINTARDAAAARVAPATSWGAPQTGGVDPLPPGVPSRPGLLHGDPWNMGRQTGGVDPRAPQGRNPGGLLHGDPWNMGQNQPRVWGDPRMRGY